MIRATDNGVWHPAGPTVMFVVRMKKKWTTVWLALATPFPAVARSVPTPTRVENRSPLWAESTASNSCVCCSLCMVRSNVFRPACMRFSVIVLRQLLNSHPLLYIATHSIEHKHELCKLPVKVLLPMCDGWQQAAFMGSSVDGRFCVALSSSQKPWASEVYMERVMLVKSCSKGHDACMQNGTACQGNENANVSMPGGMAQ